MRKIYNAWGKSNEELFNCSKLKRKITEEITMRRWNMIGHIYRMNDSRIPKIVLCTDPYESWKRPKGCVRKTTERFLKKVATDILKPYNLSCKELDKLLCDIAQDRDQWKKLGEANALKWV